MIGKRRDSLQALPALGMVYANPDLIPTRGNAGQFQHNTIVYVFASLPQVRWVLPVARHMVLLSDDLPAAHVGEVNKYLIGLGRLGECIPVKRKQQRVPGLLCIIADEPATSLDVTLQAASHPDREPFLRASSLYRSQDNRTSRLDSTRGGMSGG